MIELIARIGGSISKFNEPRSLDEDDSWIGFYNPIEDVELACNALEVFHVMPYPGGSFDQPQTLLSDMFVWFAIKSRLMYEQRQEDGLNPDEKHYQNIDDTPVSELFG